MFLAPLITEVVLSGKVSGAQNLAKRAFLVRSDCQ